MSTQEQAELGHARIIAITTVGGGTRAAPGAADVPDVVLSPWAAAGLRTTGFAMWVDPLSTAGPGAGGYTITPWVAMYRDVGGIGRRWVAFGVAAVGMAQSELWQTFDVDACELWFQIANAAGAGTVNIGIGEL